MSSLEGQLALVTGASRGIGAAIAAELAARGAQVIGTATSEGGAEAICRTLADAGGKGQGVMLNITDAAGVEAGIKQINQDFGTPTILVNNAGITRDGLLMRMGADQWDEVIDANLSGAYRVTKACLRGMLKARTGRIVNVASVVASTGNPGQSNYAAAKAGLIGFTKSLAREVGSRGITANVVAPGFIDTDMTKALPDNQREALLKDIALGRLGAPKEIAAAVAFLVSAEAAYITGETLHINGGMYMP